jgi:hypothetical protein
LLRKRKADDKSRFSKRSRDAKPVFPPKPEPEVVVPVEIVSEEPAISPEYEEKFQEVIRQTMTKKQLKALKESQESEEN